MNREMKEAKLYPPVKAWLESQGYRVYAEIWDRDVVAYDGTRIVVVELKMCLSRKLHLQLIRAATFADVVYAGVASKPSKLNRKLFEDFGILRVGEAVEVIKEAPFNARTWPQHRNQVAAILDERKWSTPDETIGGMPTIAGTGPAQRCRQRIKNYLKEHPKAGWKEIFANVPNHYAHHRSLRGAMPPIAFMLEAGDEQAST